MSHDEDVVTMLALTNAMRKRWKRRMFTMDASLCMLAAERADNMAMATSLFHIKGGPAENIGFGFESPEDALKGWMNSPEHRANIVTKAHPHIGIGGSVSEGVAWWGVLFGAGKH